MSTPSVGRIVHYRSHGTPVQADGSQAYTSECRAAVITEVDGMRPYPAAIGSDVQEADDPQTVGLCVLNPTGQFFNQGVPYDGDGHEGGTWHWPARVEETAS